MDAHKNFAYSSVATAPSPASSGTSLVLAAGGGAFMPTVPFNGVIWPTGAIPLPTNAEIVTVTNVSTDTLTIVRTQEGFGPRTVLVGDQFAAAATVKTFTDIEQLATVNLAPTVGFTIPANYGAVAVRSYTIASGKIISLGSGARFRIL